MKNKFIFRKIIDPEFWFYSIMKLTGAPSALIFERMKYIYIGGKKPKGYFRGKYIVCANHTSWQDPIILSCFLWMRRVKFIATHDLFKNKFVGWILKHSGCIPVDKNNPSLLTFKEVKKTIDHGHVCCIFPEGHINETSNIDPYKSGAIMMAVMSDADIMPAYIIKREKCIKRQIVIFGERINYKNYIKGVMPTMDEIELISSILRKKEIELKEYYSDNFKGE